MKMDSSPWLYLACVLAVCLAPGQTALTARVTVFQDDLPASDTCVLPSVLPVTIRSPQETVTLSLSLNTDMQEKTPVLLMRKSKSGSPIFIKDSLSGVKVSAMYQADTNLAQFEVTCKILGSSERRYILDGSLVLSDGKEYQMSKATNTFPWLDYIDIYTLTEEGGSAPGFNAGQYLDDDGDALSVPKAGSDLARIITSDVYIDVMALIENSVYERWLLLSSDGTAAEKRLEALDNIRRNFAHIFNAVNLRFKTASANVHIKLAGFIIEDVESGDWFDGVRQTEADQTKIEAGVLLDTMWDLAKTPGFPSHDHLVSFTSVDIYWNKTDGTISDVNGLASVAQACISPTSKSVSIVQYQSHFTADVRTTAHEIGHSLSFRHDGTAFGNDCDSADNYIMTSTPRTYDTTNNNPYVFSSCSADYLDNHVNNYLTGSVSTDFSKACLLESLPQVSVPDVTGEFHGQQYDVHEQCQLIYGTGARLCTGVDLTGITVCQKMSCLNPENGKCWWHYAARGTTCGDKKWCQEGVCVYSEDAPVANEDCLYGDRPGIVYSPLNQTCPEFIPANLVSRCDSENNRRLCCETCTKRTCNKECLNNGFLNSTSCLCVCPTGSSGDLCETNTCTKTCLNEGTLNTDTCTCACREFYTGATCQTNTCTKSCQNGGTLTTDTCTCACREFYTGTTCQTNTCTKTCLNGGTLNTDTCTCACREFYTGATCQTNTCTKTCLNGGTLNTDTCTCACREFNTGATCQTNTCTKSCQNGGTLTTDTCTCACREFYTGTTCQTNTCTKTCLNGGTLNTDTCTCACREFYTGATCQTNTCTKTCLNGGTLNTDTCTCACREFNTGATCQTNTCTKSCQNGGTLTTDTCTCACREFYTGTTCQTNTCTKTCLNGGTLNTDTCTCACREFYTGATCQTNTCTKTCLNGGTLNTDTCTCACREFNTGATCQTNTCTKTCLNGGTLNTDTCTCACREFYTGATCQTNTCSRSCLNGGTLDTDTCTCACVAPFSGTVCQSNTCTRSCLNGGTLNTDTCTCACREFYTGATCETNTCTRSCLNRGTLTTDTCTCACRDFYTGTTCETNTCTKSCLNGGTLNTDTCTCACGAFYTGATCETNTCTRTCSNGGTLNRDTCTCSCDPLWTGSTCAQCSRGCLNGGTQQSATCSCSCRDGYTGTYCGTPPSGCSRTCQNGGTLDTAACKCTCSGNYIGNSCETCGTSCPAGQELRGANCVCIPTGVKCDGTDTWLCTILKVSGNCVKSLNFMRQCPQNCRTCEIQAPDPLTSSGYE
ncbi:fibropellin-1-like isoform X7 [Haliotis rufescens]|uniref:fibropellin-1-like isoform X7 n=1 Tax=Haliotis rufescens TaxID=6454 RepID=UPI00201EA420|nr:fibropellin-1-like isoform X7 [Haliotis rufescens]